jgi:AcrR family transcriptional regulator
MKSSTTKIKADVKRRQTAGPRKPSRGRGVARFAALVEATEQLLTQFSPDEIGLYQIAEQADIPAPSVYHFFPTKEAAFDAFAESFVSRILATHREPIDTRLLNNWTDLYRIDNERARDFYNANKPSLKIFYGGFGGVNAKNLDDLMRRDISMRGYERANFLFNMPRIDNYERMAENRMGIMDSFWTTSVREFGYITDDYFEEGLQAALAYTRLYLPAFSTPRDALLEAQADGRFVRLPYDGDFEFLTSEQG